MALRGAKVTLFHFLDGTLRVRFKDRELACTPFKTLPAPQPVEDDKTPRRPPRRRRRPPKAVSTDGPRKGVDNGGLVHGVSQKVQAIA